MKTSKQQLEHVKDWERRNPGRAQARKNNWFKTPKGLAWIAKNQKRRNKKRKLWRARKRREAKAANRKMKEDMKRFGQRVAEILRGISTDDDIGTATISAIFRAAEECHIELTSPPTDD